MIDSESSQLLERFRARDEDALADLYDLVGRHAYGLAYRVLGDGVAAGDVVQQAFASLWEQEERLDPDRGSIAGILLTIVHRRAVDTTRARSRQEQRAAPLDIDPTDDPPDPADTMVPIDTHNERGRDVRAALAVLPDTQRQVVLLAYFEGLSQEGIAERLAVPLGTVKGRLRLAMQRLRHELEANDVA